MAITNFTVNNRLRELVNDVLQDTDGDATDDDLRSMLSDEQIEEFILQNIDWTEATYTFQRLGANSVFYKWFSLREQQHFFDPTFTENTDLLTTGVSTNGTPSSTILTAAASTFLTDGVETGDLVTNITTGETASVVTIDTETQLTTDAITSDYTGTDTFTVNKVVEYEIHSNGYIKQDVKNADTSIDVTATIVNIGQCLYDIFMYLANHKCQEINAKFYDGEHESLELTYDRLLKHAGMCRGAYSV